MDTNPNLKEVQDKVSMQLGEIAMEDEALMEALSLGRAGLTQYLIEVVVACTITEVLS